MIPFLLLFLACGDGSKTEAIIDTSGAGADSSEDTSDSSGPPDSLPPGSCTDPAYNPWIGTCVADYFTPCFAPSGACEVEQGASGFVTTWSNGATLTAELGAGMPPSVTLTLSAADGTVCATGAMASEGVCPTTLEQSGTTFTRTDAGSGSLTFCVTMATMATTVTCPDGTTVSSDGSMPGTVTCMFGGDTSCDMGPMAPPPA